MKIFLFFFLFVILSTFGWGQSNNNTNSPANESGKEKANSVKNLELKPQTESNAETEIIVAPAPIGKKTLDLEQGAKDASTQTQSSFALKKSKFITKQTEFNQQRTQRTYSSAQEAELENLVREISIDNSATYEGLLFYYTAGQYDLSRASALLKAYQMNPNDAQIKKEMAIFYFLTQKTDEFRTALINVFNSAVYPEAVKMYGTDLISSVPQNGILVTHGTEDSFSALYAQKVLRKREDVRIICLDWLNSPQYRDQLAKDQIKLPNSKFIDTAYLKDFCRLNAEKNIALSLTIPKEYFLPVIQQLYVSGLVFEYKEIPTDNALNNELLWRTVLNKKLLETRNHDLVLNYIPMMLQIGRLYENQYQTASQIEMDNLVEQILRSRGKKLSK